MNPGAGTGRIDAALRNEIVDFLTQRTSLNTEQDRRVAMLGAGLDDVLTNIDLNGPQYQSVMSLVAALDAYGKVDDTPALVRFLLHVARQVGSNHQHTIQCFCQQILKTPIPFPKPRSSFTFMTYTINDCSQKIDPKQHSADDYTEDLGHGVTLTMIAIPGGEFRMGAPEDEAPDDTEARPVHDVTVPSFFLSQYPITQAQWEAVMNTNPSAFKGPQRPVENVSWYDVQTFLQKLNQRLGDSLYRLPTEAEWEYACRAGTTTPFYCGSYINPEVANTREAGLLQTRDVGGGFPNAFGLYDMHGNVAEWCQDYWKDTYKDKNMPCDGSAWDTKMKSEERVIRGGAWRHNATYCRSASRACCPDSDYDNAIGFRIARSITA